MRLQRFRLAILGLWLGAMTFFSFVVAPAAFSALPQQQLAGALVSRTLGALEVIGVAIGGLLLLFLIFSKERGKGALFELVTVALMTISSLISRFVVSSRMHEMRTRFGEIAQLAVGDPARVAFDRLHQYSVWLMGFNIIAAIALIVILSRRNQVK
jgi:lipoprotein signal peptidase